MLMHALFAQARSSTTATPAEIPWPAISAIAVALVLFGILLMVVKRYKRCPSNRVLVVFGKTSGGNAAKCIHGGASFVWPLYQDFAYLTLDPIQIEVPLKGALSIENIRVNVPSVFTVAIGTDLATMQNAAIRLLGLDTDEIKQQAGDIIFGVVKQMEEVFAAVDWTAVSALARPKQPGDPLDDIEIPEV